LTAVSNNANISHERVIQFYRNAAGSCPVQELLDELDDRTLAKILAVFQLIESQPMIPV
jgi:hypothetical protein